MATAATKTGTEVPHGPKGPFPPFAKEHFPSQILWFAIAFGLLYLLLSRLALPRLAAIFADRRERIATDLEEAGKLKAESEAAISAYEQALAAARARAQATVAEHQQKLAAEAERRRKELDAALGEKLAAAEKQIAATSATAMQEVRGIAIEAAGAIVERLIGERPAQPALERAVDAALH